MKLFSNDDKILLIIGQDLESIEEYKSDVTDKIFGITQYSSPMTKGYELTNDFDPGCGTLNISRGLSFNEYNILSIGMEFISNNEVNTAKIVTGKINYGAADNLTAILNGEYDIYIEKLAHIIADSGKTVLLRVGYEPEGDWNHYEPTKYVKVYRHIVNLVKPIAENVKFVWQSATSPWAVCDSIYDESGKIIGKDESRNLLSWYPGDEYVDLFGMSYFYIGFEPFAEYVNNNPEFEVYSLLKPVTNVYKDFLNLARSKNKCVAICESTPQGYDIKNLTRSWIGIGEKKLEVKLTAEKLWDEWFAGYFKFIYENRDIIRFVAYINANWNAQPMWGEDDAGLFPNGYWGDSRVQGNEIIKKKWLHEISRKDIWIHDVNEIKNNLVLSLP